MKLDFQHSGRPVSFEGYEGDHVSEVIRRTGDFYEASFLRLVEDMQPGGTIVDAGAYIGNHSVFFAMFTPADLVVAVEPMPSAAHLLMKNVAANGVQDKIKLVQAAVVLNTSHAPLDMRTRRAGNRGHTRLSYRPYSEKRQVEETTLDDLTEGLGRISLVKVDIEGHSLEALVGAQRLLTEERPVFVVEARSRKEERWIEEDFLRYGYSAGMQVTQGTRTKAYFPDPYGGRLTPTQAWYFVNGWTNESMSEGVGEHIAARKVISCVINDMMQQIDPSDLSAYELGTDL